MKEPVNRHCGFFLEIQFKPCNITDFFLMFPKRFSRNLFFQNASAVICMLNNFETVLTRFFFEWESISLFFLICFASISITKINKRADIEHPCYIPFSIKHDLEIDPSFFILKIGLLQSVFILPINPLPKLNFIHN